MAIFNPLTEATIRREFTHIGWFGLCPIYIGQLQSQGPIFWERNGIPEWWLEFNQAMIGFGIWCCSLIDPFYEPEFPFLITGAIEG